MIAAVSLQLTACAPPTQHVAVVYDSSGVLVLNSEFSPSDSLTVEPAERGRRIQQIAFSPGGGLIYVADSGHSSSVAAIRRYDGVTVDRHHLGTGLLVRALAALPDAKTLLVLVQSKGDLPDRVGISFHATNDLSVTTHLDICDGQADGITVMRNGDRAYARCSRPPSTLVEIDLQLRRVVRAAPDVLTNECGRGDIALSRTEGFLYVSCFSSGALIYIDRSTLEPEVTVSVGPGSNYIAVSHATPHVLVANETIGDVSLVDLASRRVEARAPLPNMPKALEVTGDGAWGLVATTSELLVFSMTGLDLVAAVKQQIGASVASWPGVRSPTLIWR